jgi:hypothetical protein
MANQFFESIYTLDTAGMIVTPKPLWVSKIVLEPNAASDLCVFNFWDTSAPYAELSGTYTSDAIAGTITSTTTLTMASGTLLPSAVRDGDIFKITSGTGAAANIGTTNVVTTAGNNTVVVCANAAWTNESTKKYQFITYPFRPAFKLMVPTTDKVEVQLDFGPRGKWLPNLILETLSSSAIVKVYIA